MPIDDTAWDNPARALVLYKAEVAWKVGPARVLDWLANFNPDELDVALRLLLHFTWYPQSAFGALCAAAMRHRLRPHLLRLLIGQGIPLESPQAPAAFAALCRATWVVPLRAAVGVAQARRQERSPSSGDMVSYLCSDHLLPGMHAVNDLDRIGAPVRIIVAINDFIGTGKQAGEFIEVVHSHPIFQGDDPPRVVLLAFGALDSEEMNAGLRALRSEKVDALAVDTFTDEHRAFSAVSAAFPETSERARAREMAERYGLALDSNLQLGFRGSQMMVAYGDQAPNNTLPIFWKRGTVNGKTWRPLI